jgi:alpha-mannosidase
MDYEIQPRDEASGARVAATLLRCVGKAGPALGVPGAQCLGTHRFRLAFEPRGSGCSSASLFARARAFSSPPRVVPAIHGGGAAPLAASFLTLETSRGGVVVNACKHADDRAALVMRLSNPDDTTATVRVRALRPLRHASFVDFLEVRTQDLQVRDGGVEVVLGPAAVTTIELEF